MVDYNRKKILSLITDNAEQQDEEKELLYQNLINFRSKYKYDILNCIYDKGRVSNKELCEYADITASGLNPILTRLLELNPKVLTETPHGRNKYYELTALTREVIMEKGICNKAEPTRQMYADNPLYMSLKQLQTALGENWEFILDEYYIGHLSLDSKISDAIKEFENEIKYTILNEGTDKIEEFSNYLGNKILISRLTSSLSRLTDIYNKLKLICELDDQSNIDAMLLIDDICKCVIKDQNIIPFQKEYEKYGFEEKSSFEMIIQIIHEMYHQVQRMNKMDIYNKWKDELPERNQKLLFYMAEKFSTL